tara:strand:+ start:28589 stop:28792 length:204 start_codon:yes stop_codon:yes gene_type:complete
MAARPYPVRFSQPQLCIDVMMKWQKPANESYAVLLHAYISVSTAETDPLTIFHKASLDVNPRYQKNT